MQTADSPSRRTGIQWVDLSLGACAIFVSLVSLLVGANENRTQQRMLAASIWPILQYDTSNADEQGGDEVSFIIENAGIGPARVKWFVLLYQGREISDSRDLLTRCCADDLRLLNHPFRTTSSGIQRRVLLPNKSISFFRFPKSADADSALSSLWRRVDQERWRFQARICYCSVLDDCWLLDSSKGEPVQIASCEREAQTKYYD
jgi:hypothetical protein